MVEKSGVEILTQNLGLRLGVEKFGVEMSFNRAKYFLKSHISKGTDQACID